MQKHAAGMTIIVRFSVFALALLLLLAACGGSSSPTASGGSTPTVAPTATPTPTPTPTPVPTPTASTGGNSVTIAGFAFSPQSLTVKVGTKVTWTNNDGVTHTVTADKGAFSSGPISSGTSFSFTFTRAGTYTYFCSIHRGMKAMIIVQ
jgi:plastocyanin